MKPDDKQHPDLFDASLPLPIDDSSPKITNDQTKTSQEAAADLIRRRVDAAYANEPSAIEEIAEVEHLAPTAKESKHQKFIDELLNSGKSVDDIQIAWHEYYAGLTDREKHEVWGEFYNNHARLADLEAQAAHPAPAKIISHNEARIALRERTQLSDRAKQLKAHVASRSPKHRSRAKSASPLHSLVFGFGIGVIVIFFFLFSFFNERFIAPFIQPSRNVTNTPIISDTTTVGSSPEIIIPKINVEIPVVYDVTTIDDSAVETALEGGVVHYADTALPGQNGNGVIVGHSSNNIFNQGKYKFAFVLLSRLDNGDTFYLQKDSVRYTYQVYKKQIVSPTDVSVLGNTDKAATFTLITCDPPGTSTNRLVVVGEQISPDPTGNLAASSANNIATKSPVIPGNSPTLWSRFVKWL